MNEIFTRAAFGQLTFTQISLPSSVFIPLHCLGDKHSTKPPAPYSIFDKGELENRVVRVVPFLSPYVLV
jgi:hypothetical protein